MPSARTIRDPVQDKLLTPENAAMIIIDFQPVQVSSVTSRDRHLLVRVCLVHPALDVLSEGFEVYPVVDAVGGTTLEAHEAGLKRLIQAGGRPTTWVQLACELQRDWNRTKTAAQFTKIPFAS